MRSQPKTPVWAELENTRRLVIDAKSFATDLMDKISAQFRRQQLQHLVNCALAVTVIYTQLIVLLMATSVPQEKAIWNEAETAAFVEYLWEHKSEGGDGSFKDVTMRAAAEHIADKHTAGPVKVLKHCKTKWTAVSHPPF